MHSVTGKPNKSVNSKTFKGVHRLTANGKRYFYAWRGGPKLSGDPLHDPAAAREFLTLTTDRAPSQSSLFPAVVLRFQGSSVFQSRRPGWRRETAKIDEILVEFFKTADLSFFERAGMRKYIHRLHQNHAATPRQADKIIAELNAILNWAKDQGEIATHVAGGIPRLSKSDRSEIIWTDDEIARVADHLTDHQRPLFLLASLTAIDLVDLCNLTWSNIGDFDIRGRRQKTNKVFHAPILPETRAILDALPKVSTHVLTNSKGRPWTPDGFKSVFQRAKASAGVTDKRFKDLRGTAATRFIAAGLTYDEVATIVGWTTKNVDQIARRYIHRGEVASAIVQRLENAPGTKTVKKTVKSAKKNKR